MTGLKSDINLKNLAPLSKSLARPQWRDLTSGGRWTYMPSLSTHYYTRLVALSSTEAYMVMMVVVMVVMVVETLVVVMIDLQSLESFSFVHLPGLS